jgi:HipA-like protein
VYSQLEDYLAFCVKALGELPQLEKGAPGDFARAINDVLTAHINRLPLGIKRMIPAFRRCSGRWPDVMKLAVGMTDTSDALFNWDFQDLLIAAGGRALRSDLLLSAARLTTRLLPQLNSSATHLDAAFMFSVCQEACRLGPWTDEESSSLMKGLHDRSEIVRASAAEAIVGTLGSCHREEDPPVELLADVACDGESTDLRLMCARTLWRAGFHKDTARRVLLEMARTKGTVAELAVDYLADEGLGLLVLTELEQFAPTNGRLLVHLAILAEQHPAARPALDRALASLRAHRDPVTFLYVASAAWKLGYNLFIEDEILTQWRRITDPEGRRDGLLRFNQISGAEGMLVRACGELLDQDPMNAIWISSICIELTPEAAGPMLLDVWARLLELRVTDLWLPLASRILDLGVAGSVGALAAKIRGETLLPDTPEGVGLQAARQFRRTDPRAEIVLEDLALHAKEERVRHDAASLTGNLTSLNTLAQSTKHEHLKNKIRSTLDLYGEINALLQVGKLRRARVRFDGRDVGVLEELTKVGNGTRFRYDDGYDGPPIAPNMPLTKKTYEDTESLLPFFANLLPEGALYEQTARKLGVKRSDRLGVLLRVGADTMGAVEILPMESA